MPELPAIAVRSPRRTAYALALALAAVTSVFLLRIPVQLSDSFTEFMGASSTPLREVVGREFEGGPYMRPFRRGLIKVVYDLSAGHYQAAFRGFQVAQLFVLLLFVIGAMRVRSPADLSVIPMTLALVIGAPTFAGAILEGLPINHFLTILICCAAAINLARAKPAIGVDVAAVALLIFAMLTIESGLVVAAVFVAAYAVGYRGVSRFALAALVLCVVAYAAGRFGMLGGTTPGLGERSAGFGFRVLDTGELIRRFGSNPLPFYLYNVVSAISMVLFAEPRGGVWSFTSGVVNGTLEPWRLLSVVTSTAMTLLIGGYAVTRMRRWLRGEFDTDADRLVVIFLAVLVGNAVFAFAYEKDAILGPAGLFYALAAAAVLRELVTGQSLAWGGRIASVLLLVAACGWTLRLVGIHYSLQVRDLSTRNEWVYYYAWERKQNFGEPFTARETEIKEQLRRQAIRGAGGVRIARNRITPLLFDVTQ